MRDTAAGRAEGWVSTRENREARQAGKRYPREPLLPEVGISKKQSHKWQKLAAVPDKQFEAAVTDRTTKPTTNGIIRQAEVPKINPVSAEALWLWGRLRDFERDGYLNKDPQEVMATMTAEMKNDVHTLAPKVSAWLRKIGALI